MAAAQIRSIPTRQQRRMVCWYLFGSTSQSSEVLLHPRSLGLKATRISPTRPPPNNTSQDIVPGRIDHRKNIYIFSHPLSLVLLFLFQCCHVFRFPRPRLFLPRLPPVHALPVPPPRRIHNITPPTTTTTNHGPFRWGLIAAAVATQYDRYRLLVLVAGGIGVTPCISLLRHLSLLARAGSLPHCLEDGVRLVSPGGGEIGRADTGDGRGAAFCVPQPWFAPSTSTTGASG